MPGYFRDRQSDDQRGARILHRWGSLERAFQGVLSVSARDITAKRARHEAAIRSRLHLVTRRTDVPISPLSPSTCRVADVSWEAARAWGERDVGLALCLQAELPSGRGWLSDGIA